MVPWKILMKNKKKNGNTMKRITYIISAIIVLLTSCNQDEINKIQSSVVLPKVTACFEESNSRTYVAEDKWLHWSAGDQISLFLGNTVNHPYIFDGETGDNSGTFSPSVQPSGFGRDLDCLYAVYPYRSSVCISDGGVLTVTLPSEQNYVENSFGLGDNTMVAVTQGVEDTSLKFKNIGGFLKLQLYGKDVTVKSILLQGNSQEKIAGKATVTSVYEVEPTTNMSDDATETITLDCGEFGIKLNENEEDATTFWLVVPPTIFEEGFTITVTDVNGDTFTKSTSNEIVIKRNVANPMKAIEVKINQIPNNQIWYTATAKVVPNKPSDYWSWTSYYKIVSNEWNETTGKGVITFSDDVTSIGEHAFSDKSTLKSIILPNTITYIDDYAFEDCSSLVNITIPDNVTKIGIRAFKDCTSLEEFKGKFASEDGNCLIVNGVLNSFAPVGITEYTIPSSVQEIGVWVFNQCSNLTSITIPENVTKIGEGAFAYCYGLTNITIPDGVTDIGNYAFYYCKSLKDIYIKCTTSPSIGNDTFRTYCNEDINIYVPKDNVVSYSTANCWSMYLNNLVAYDFEKGEEATGDIPYLTFTAKAEQTLRMSVAVETLEYSVNNQEWKELGTSTVTFGGEKGDLRLRGKSAKGTGYSEFRFGNSTKVSCNGDIRTLVRYKNYDITNTSEAQFRYLFYGCKVLTKAPELPATNLASYCYGYMFSGCTALTKAPELPATNLASDCYSGMFSGCTALTQAPELPATNLASDCYGSMFSGCTALTQAPKLPATNLASYCYSSMFYGCTALTQAPQLPATKLASDCYRHMFNGCTALTHAPELPATKLASDCYSDMFSGCTALTQAPELPAATLAEYCYYRMFEGCKNLNQITMLATDISAYCCLSGWLNGVSSTGTFIKAKNMNSLSTGSSGIPKGWTVIDR